MDEVLEYGRHQEASLDGFASGFDPLGTLAGFATRSEHFAGYRALHWGNNYDVPERHLPMDIPKERTPTEQAALAGGFLVGLVTSPLMLPFTLPGLVIGTYRTYFSRSK